VVATVIPKYPPRPTIIATNFQKFIQSAHNGPLNNEGKGGGVLQVETVDRLWGSFGDRGSLVRFLPPHIEQLDKASHICEGFPFFEFSVVCRTGIQHDSSLDLHPVFEL
jgi:hypothetical protein